MTSWRLLVDGGHGFGIAGDRLPGCWRTASDLLASNNRANSSRSRCWPDPIRR